MRRIGSSLVPALALLAGSFALADDWPQWRGPDRTGVSKETGLLKAWPEDGPKELWAITNLGKGYGSPSIADGTIYITGAERNKAVLYALGLDGKCKWKEPYGALFTKIYPVTRTTPTVEKGCVYVYSSGGSAACFDAKTGKPKWTVDTMKKFEGQNIRWGIAESPLIVGDLYICQPGGPDAAVVALNKSTGKTVWTSKGLGERSAYCSPLLIQVGDMQGIVTQTEDNIVGLNARTGEVLWKIYQRNKYAVHPNTPLFFDNMIFISSGYGQGSQLLKLSADGTKASQVWRERRLDCHHEGVLLIDGYIYGSPSRGRLLCMDPKDGKVLYLVQEVKKASITCAGERLYAYDEKGGGVSLIEVSSKGYKICGRFTVKRGSGEHWPHPVVANGVLYVRHGEALMAYDVKAE